MFKELIKKWLGIYTLSDDINGLKENLDKIKDLDNRISELETAQEKLLSFRSEILQSKPVLQYCLDQLQEKPLSRKEMVNILTSQFDISRATAYRRLNTLENELQYIVEKEDNKLYVLNFNKKKLDQTKQ